MQGIFVHQNDGLVFQPLSVKPNLLFRDISRIDFPIKHLVCRQEVGDVVVAAVQTAHVLLPPAQDAIAPHLQVCGKPWHRQPTVARRAPW